MELAQAVFTLGKDHRTNQTEIVTIRHHPVIHITFSGT